MGNSSSPYSTLILIAVMVLAFYLLIIRPNKKRQQAQQQTLSSLTPGTRVLLTSGVFGTLLQVGQKQAVVELSPGVELTVLKQAIARPVRDGDEDSADDDEPFEDSVDDLATDSEAGDLAYESRAEHDDLAPDRSSTDRRPADGPLTDGHVADRTEPHPGTSTTPIKD
jgi:preprotein translocase subunit YajC